MGHRDKVFIKVEDIVYVITHHDSRNKIIKLTDGSEHVIMHYTMAEILNFAPHLLRPNKSELVSRNIIFAHGFDHIYIKIPNNEEKKMVNIGYNFSKNFKLQLLNT